MPTATLLAVTATVPQAFVQTPVAGPAWFPARNLGIKAELLLNGSWVDITRYVYQRNGIGITGMGRADWTSTIQAAQATLTLDNRTGRFSPKNSSGAYYPFIARNTQLRISVSSQSSTGASYAGYRFWGEVAEWPPRWDPSESDITSEVVANGIWRRISQLQTTLGSAYTRYNSITLTGSSAPRAYWPMEDGAGSTQLVPYDSVAGTANATFTVLGTNAPSLAASTDFKGSDGIVQLNGALITCTVPAGGTPTNNCTRFLISVPAGGDSASGTVNWDLIEINSSGTVAKFEVLLMTTGHLRMYLRNSGGTVLATADTTTNIQGMPVLASCELTPSGGNVNFAFRIIAQGAAGITESMTGTLTTASVGTISSVRFSRGNTLMDTAVGQLSVTYGAVPSMVSAAAALAGYPGEKAMDRFTRICGEVGIAAETIGTAASTAAMGPQLDDHLGDVLQTIEDTDCGLLFESRGQFGLGYRSNASMANQAAAATFNYAAATLDTSLAPAYDDSLTRNNITVTNTSTGFTQQAILTTGAMSVLNPPSGVGNGYAFTRSVNAAADSQLPGIATFLLNLGTVDEVRFPAVTLKMVRTSSAPLFAAVPGIRIGDYIQITNPPSFLTSTTIRQLAWGYSETLNAREWTFAFNCVPETPWEVGFSPGTVQNAQIPGGSASVSTAPGAGGLGGIVTSGSITPAMLNEGITLHTLGGNAVTISASAPATPNLNDLWIASATGLISQWNGTAWIPYKFDGTATIQAATISAAQIVAHTITASQIAAGTITAAEIAAGIIVAGIVDATQISSAEFLGYSGTPATGSLFLAASPTGGVDSYNNQYGQGLNMIGVAGIENLISVSNATGETLATIDADGDVNANIVNAAEVYAGGTGITESLSGMASGVINRAWTPTSIWPATPIGTTDTAILELDQTLEAGRSYKITVTPTTYVPTITVDAQLVMYLRATTDGSTPTTSTTVLTGPRITSAGSSLSGKNFMTPYMEYITPSLASDTLYRFLLTGHIQSGTFKFQDYTEIRIEDIGPYDPNTNLQNGLQLGTGTTGGAGSGALRTKTYYATATHSYYGNGSSYGGGSYSKRSDNSSVYQGKPSGPYPATGDQFSFANFDYATIAADLSGATIQWIKLRLTCVASWYSSGLHAVVGTTTATTFGSTFTPGASETQNRTNYVMKPGQTITHTLPAAFGTAFQSGGAKAIMLGTSDSYTTPTDLSNYGAFFGYSASNHASCPMLQIRYIK